MSQLEEWPPLGEDNQILRLEVRPEHGDRHFLILREETYDQWKNYEKVGEKTVLSLSHIFDTVYGVSFIAGMDAETAIRIGQEMIKWGKAQGQDDQELDLDAVQKAIEAIDAHFPTSSAYKLLSEAVPDGIRAYLKAV